MTPRPPLVIWTLRRTGGTNLGSRLIEALGRPTVGHEPFNADREYGHITGAWNREGDAAALQAAMRTLCEQPVSLKHCVELVPLEISQALADATARAGYRHLFLYRRQPLRRLLSLQFAKVSGIWGPKQTGSLDETTGLDLPVAELSQDEARGAGRLGQLWQRLLDAGSLPLELAYEDLYETADATDQRDLLRRTLAYLDLYEGEAALEAFRQRVVNQGDQQTRDRYSRFRNIEALAAALQAVPPFAPARPLRSAQPRALPLPTEAAVTHAVIDSRESQPLWGDDLRLGGVVVLARPLPGACLVLRDAEGRQHPVEWDISSPRMAQLHPAAPNRERARFRLQGFTPRQPGTLLLQLCSPGEPALDLFEIRVDTPPAAA